VQLGFVSPAVASCSFPAETKSQNYFKSTSFLGAMKYSAEDSKPILMAPSTWQNLELEFVKSLRTNWIAYLVPI